MNRPGQARAARANPAQVPAVRHFLAVMSALGPTRARNMFGGAGLYCDDLFFAMFAGGTLYLKVDAESLGDFQAAGARPFVWIRPQDGKPVPMSYWSLPEIAVDPAAQRDWGEKALAAARRARQSGPKSRRSRRREQML